MSDDTTPQGEPLADWRVGVTADRRADQQADVFRRRGAEVVVGTTMRILDLSDDDRLLAASRSLIDDPPATTGLQTGMGLTMWLDAMDAVGIGDDLRRALNPSYDRRTDSPGGRKDTVPDTEKDTVPDTEWVVNL